MNGGKQIEQRNKEERNVELRHHRRCDADEYAAPVAAVRGGQSHLAGASCPRRLAEGRKVMAGAVALGHGGEGRASLGYANAAGYGAVSLS